MALGGPNVTGLVRRWKPSKWYRKEKNFENDLADYLRENTHERTTVRTQGRQKIDIRVGEDTGIELKRKLTPSKADRLMGQLTRYDYPNIMVVVCGSSDNAWEDLTELIDQEYRGSFQQSVTPIRKEKGGTDKEGGGLFGGSDSLFDI